MTDDLEFRLSQPCNAIEGIGLTSALDYHVANGDYTYILGLHKTDDCSDTGGTYQGECILQRVAQFLDSRAHRDTGSADQPICVPTNGYRAYSVRTLAAVSKKRRTLSERRESNKVIAARSPTAYGGLSKRANDCYTPAFALGAFGLSATFYYYATGVCPASAKEEDVNKAQCGIAATVGTVSFLLTGYSLQGIYRTSKRSLLDDLDVDLPFEDITILPGHTVSMTKHSVEADEELGGDWIHYATDLVRHSNNAQHSGFISFHPSGHRRVSLQVDDEGLSEGINKRAPNGATAYYGWVDGDTESFFNTDGGACTDDNTIDRLGLQLWDVSLPLDVWLFGLVV